MRTVYIVGASHSVRIEEALRQLPEYNVQFNVLGFGKSGAKFSQFRWPDLESIDQGDVLLVFPLGNDLIQGKCHFKRNRILHLQNYEQTDDLSFRIQLNLLRSKLGKCKGKKIVVTNFYRHFCCQDHPKPGWLSYQNLRNAQLYGLLDTDPSITIVNHRKIVSDTNRELRNTVQYRALQYDSVHFKDYAPIAKGLVKYILD